MIQLEICANSLASALAAQEGGADRVELCDNMAEGGTTTSYGTLIKARELLTLQLYPIIRPRGGDFLYDEIEFDIMYKEVEFCKQIGCDGVVIGLLDEDGNIDLIRTKKLVDAAYPLEVTFHRAFDRCRSPFQALEDIIASGCERILTSGQQPTASEGVALLNELVQKADDRIIIMPGSGVRPENIAALVKETGATEYHSTAKTSIDSKMKFENSLAQKEDLTVSITDKDIVRELRKMAGDVQEGRREYRPYTN